MRTFTALLVFSLIVAPVLQGAATAPDPAGIAFFEAKIRPVLVEQCYKCHSTEAKSNGKLKAELYLDSREGTLGALPLLLFK